MLPFLPLLFSLSSASLPSLLRPQGFHALTLERRRRAAGSQKGSSMHLIAVAEWKRNGKLDLTMLPCCSLSSLVSAVRPFHLSRFYHSCFCIAEAIGPLSSPASGREAQKIQATCRIPQDMDYPNKKALFHPSSSIVHPDTSLFPQHRITNLHCAEEDMHRPLPSPGFTFDQRFPSSQGEPPSLPRTELLRRTSSQYSEAFFQQQTDSVFCHFPSFRKHIISFLPKRNATFHFHSSLRSPQEASIFFRFLSMLHLNPCSDVLASVFFVGSSKLRASLL